MPAVNQSALHPKLQQAALCAFHRAHGIATELWSPLARGDLGDPVFAAIARKHGKTPAQAILRRHIERGLIAIPRSAHPPRIRENMGIFDFALDADDMAKFAGLDAGRRIGPDPATF